MPGGPAAGTVRLPQPQHIRLSLLPAVALLLGAYSLFVAAPADAERIPRVSLIAPSVMDEGDWGDVIVRLSAPLEDPVTIPVTVSGSVTERGTGNYTITAATGNLENPTSISFTIAAGSTESSVRIRAHEDKDAAHQFITLALDWDNLPASVLPTVPHSVQIGVRDDDAPPVPAVRLLEIVPNPVPEGSPVSVSVLLSEVEPVDVTIPLTVTRRTSEVGDHGTLASITIPAAHCCNSGTIATTRDDDDDDETFTVALGTLPAGVRLGSPASALVTISEGSGTPESTQVAVSLPESLNPVPEGSSVAVTATLSAVLEADVEIPVRVTRDTSESEDHEMLSSITINSGSTTGTGTIVTNQDDDTDDETFTVALDGSLPTSVSEGSPNSVEITITDDDQQPPGENDPPGGNDPPASTPASAVWLAAEPNPVAEGNPVTVTATLAAELSNDVTIPLTLTAGTAEAGDYGPLASITISGGTTSGTGTVTTVQDVDTEDETFTVALGSLPDSVEADSPDSVEVTIEDVTIPAVQLSAAPNPVTEGNPVTVTATLAAALANDVTVPLTVTRGTSEPGDHGTLADIPIGAGATSGTGTITTAQDADTDDETFTVALGDTLPDSVQAGSPAAVEVTIDDDDTAAVSLSAAPNPVLEGSSVTVTAWLSMALSDAVTIPLAVRRVTSEPGDHGTLTGITIDPGATSGTGTVTTVRDTDTEDERFAVALGRNLPDAVSAGSPRSVEVTITDTTKTLTLSHDRAPAEGGPAVTVSATLNKPAPATGTMVTLVVSGTATRDTGSGGDYTLSASTIVIAAGQRQGWATITVTDDTDVEDGETIVLAATSDTPALTDRLTLTITDNDEPPTPPSGDASLSSLKLSAGTLEPRFAANTRDYTAEVAHEVASVTVTPTVRDSRASVTVNGAAFASGTASDPISLREGETVIEVTVTAENAVTLTYTVTVTRAAAPPPAVTEEHRRQRLQVSLAGLGRSVAASAVSVIGQRLVPATHAAGEAADLAGVELTMNRRAWQLPGPGDAAAGGWLAPGALQAPGMNDMPAGHVSVISVSEVELLSGSAFRSHRGRGGGWGVWGSGAYSGFQGEVGEFEQDGGVLAGYLGTDYRFGADALVGLAASYGSLELTTTSSAAGQADLTGWLVNVYPYGFWTPVEWLGLWAIAGLGGGAAEVAEQDAGDSEEGELGAWLGAAGQRVELLSGGGLSLAAKADGFVTGLTAGGELPAASAHAWRVRVLLEGGLEWHAADTRLSGRVDVGGRLDGGDAEQGLGAEAGAEVSYTHTGIGLGIGGRGRLLLVHEDQAIRDWGASATLRWEPAGTGTGPALSVVPAWGRLLASGQSVLWQDRPPAQEHLSNAGATDRGASPWLPDSVALRLSYGLAAGTGRVLPYAEVGLDAAQVRRLRAGATVALSPAGYAPGGVLLEAFGQRTSHFGSAADYRLGLEGALKY